MSKETYIVNVKCSNCGEEEIREVEKGYYATAAESEKCQRCGCESMKVNKKQYE